MDRLPPRLLQKLERLAAARIRLLPLPAIETHFVLERDGFAALVEQHDRDFGQVGAAGLVTPQGLAVLVWQAGKPFFVHKKTRIAATDEQVLRLREFTADLEEAIRRG